MNAAEKNSNQQTERSAIHAGLYSALERLHPLESLEFLKKAIESHPRVAMVTVITEEELHEYYVRGNREL